jgi:hypothetical protein
MKELDLEFCVPTLQPWLLLIYLAFPLPKIMTITVIAGLKVKFPCTVPRKVFRNFAVAN